MNIIVGRKPVLDALQSDVIIERVHIAQTAKGQIIDDIIALARRKNIPFKISSPNQVEKFSAHHSTQGVVAFIGTKEFTDIDELLAIAQQRGEKPFLIVFDEIEDVHNLGALIRTAVCAGAHGGIVPKHHNAPVNETVIKTSAGASLQFPMARVTNIAQTIDSLKEAGVWIVGTEMNAEKEYTSLDLDIPVAVIVGNEGKGMRRLVKEKCDFLVRIPMKGDFESLNASVAGALVMYEVMRKRSRS